MWLDAGILFNEGMERPIIERFEARHGITLPSEFKEYLMTVNGMKNGQVDEHLISFLSLEDIDQQSNVKQVVPNEIDLTVAEYSLYAHWYVMRVTRNADRCCVLASDDEHEKPIAGSFQDFVETYLSNPSKVANCWL
jgi:hypothetical protein